MINNLIGCSNAGLSLTDQRRIQFLEMYEWIMENKALGIISYVEMQKMIEANTSSLDDSKVRMFVPFFRKLGFIYHTDSDLVDLNRFFTKVGLAFGEHIKVMRVSEGLQNKEIHELLIHIDNLFCQYGLLSVIESGEWVYLECLKMILEYKYIEKNEFFIMTTLKQAVSGENFNHELRREISEYRSTIPKPNLIISKHQNCYGYVVPYLEECGLVYRNEGSVHIMPNKIETIMNIVENYK